MPGGRKSSQGTVRVVVRKQTTVTPSRDTNGEDVLESENESVDEDDDPEGDGTLDMVSLHKQFSKIQKHLTQLTKAVARKPQSTGLQEPPVASPVSVTSSTIGEVMVYESDEAIHRLHAVVGTVSEEAMHDPTASHISPAWKQNLHNHEKQQQDSDKRHINTYSCFAHLLLIFYTRVQNNERHTVDEAIELALDYFVEVQCRLQYPNMTTAPTVTARVRTTKFVCFISLL
jgi:hypothetical protein